MFFKKKRFEDSQGYARIRRTLEDGEEDFNGQFGDFDDEEYVFDDEEEGVTPVENLDSLDLLGRNTQPLPPLDQPTAPEQEPPVEELPMDFSKSRQPAASQAPQAAAPPPAPAPPVQAPAGPMHAPAPPQQPRAASAPVPSTPPSTVDVVTLVSKGARWEGKLASEGDIRVEGSLQGEIETDGTVFIADDAKVSGTVHARNVLIAGTLEGEIFCKERLEVLPGGTAKGQINTSLVVVHEGAFVDSRFKMVRGDASTKPELQGSSAR